MSEQRTGAGAGSAADLPMERLREAAANVLAETPDVVVAYAFGSRVAGRPLPMSDLDLLLVLRDDEAATDPLLAEGVAARIASRLRTSIEIDAHLSRDLPLAVRGRAITEGILLYDVDPSRRVEFETSTRRLYFDFLPFLERDAREALTRRG